MEVKPLPVHPPFALRLIPGATPSPSLPKSFRFVRFTTEATTNNSEPCIDELELWTTGKKFPQRGQKSQIDLLGKLRQQPQAQARSPQRRQIRQRLQLDLQPKEARDGFSSNYLSPPSSTASSGGDKTGRYQDRLPTKYRIEGGLEPGKWFLLTNSNDRLPFKTKKTKPTPRYDFSLHPPKKPNGEEKSWLNSKKSRGASPPSRNQTRSTPAPSGSRLRPGSCIGGTHFPQRKSSPPKDWMY